jgi:regulator of sigma E protease
MNNWYLLAAIPVFGLLVIVHEFGHFITAKWAGIRVEEFGLGFPPRLVGIRKREGRGWDIIWFGGGRTNTDGMTDLKQTPFAGTSGGVTMSSSQATNHTIYSLNLIPIGGFVRMPGENGDLLDTEGKYDPQSFAAKSAGKRIIVLCAGVIMNFLLAMVLFIFAYGFGEPKLLPQIGAIVAGSPADQVGLRPNDTIISANGQPVTYLEDLQAIVNQAIANDHNKHATVPVVIQVLHAGAQQPVTVTINVREHPPAGQGPMGIQASGRVAFDRIPLWQAPAKGIQHTFEITGQFIQSIVQMITGQIPAQIAGPVGIVKITGQVASDVPSYGWWPLLSLTAVLSLNLAIVNILPIPALDGGRVILVVIELLRGGKRLKPEREGIINFIGMAILLLLMAIITVSDVVHWGG